MLSLVSWLAAGLIGIHAPAVLTAVPAEGLLGEPIRIDVTGARPGARVTLRVTARGRDGRVWRSSAIFVASRSGRVCTTDMAPVAGAYSGVDPAGLFWSMAPSDDRPWSGRQILIDNGVVFEIAAETGGVVPGPVLARRALSLPANALMEETLKQAGLEGVLVYQKGASSLPAVIVLSGSEGGLATAHAEYLASHGLAALALGYFGLGELPAELVEIPLEPLGKAIEWLHAHPVVGTRPVAVLGGSRGGELALLAGATFPEFKTVVSFSGSSLVWQGISRLPTVPRSAWTLGGKPVPFLPSPPPTVEDLQALAEGRPLHLRSWFSTAKRTAAEIDAASIAVERIQGPVLLVTGTDDQMWPATAFAERAMARLAGARRRYPDAHLRNEGAGHNLPFPYLPSGSGQISQRFVVGGTPAADGRAAASAWPQIVAFLRRHLGLE